MDKFVMSVFSGLTACRAVAFKGVRMGRAAF